MASIEKQIRASIESFVAELNALVRQAAVEAVQGALGGSPDSNPRNAKRGLKTPEQAPTPRRRTRRGRRVKRSPKTLARLQSRLLDEISRRPGQRIEAISRSMGVSTKDLNLPIKKLLEAKRIEKRGEKRATEYFTN
jgi:hypothetical protein